MKKSSLYTIICFIFGAILLTCVGIAAETGSPVDARRTPMVRAVATVMPAVVNISTEQVVRVVDPFDAFFNDFFGRHSHYYKESIPLGSGVIIDEAGLVLTNKHVLNRASRIKVRLWNGEMHFANPIASDAANDLALLQIQPAETDGKAMKFTAVEFAAPDDLLLGETVVAVGNPFGLEHSVSAGVLSARNRRFEDSGVVFQDILQTDAAINPGNSGGPLINLNGELIGINLAIRRDAEGIGFAIPVKRIEEVLAAWLIPEFFANAACGLIPGTQVKDSRMSAFAARVEPGSPAAVAGLRTGDALTAVNGCPVARAIDIGRAIWRLTAADKLLVATGGDKPVEIVVGRLDADTLIRRRLGIQVQELTPALQQALGLPQDIRGMIISEVAESSDMAAAGVRRGDILYRLGEVDINATADILRVLDGLGFGNVVPAFLVVSQRIRGRGILRRVALNITLR